MNLVARGGVILIPTQTLPEAVHEANGQLRFVLACVPTFGGLEVLLEDIKAAVRVMGVQVRNVLHDSNGRGWFRRDIATVIPLPTV